MPTGLNLLRIIVFFLSSMPLFYLGWLIGQQQLGPDPAEFLLEFFAQWALTFLALTLCISPLRQISGYSGFMRLRRMLGLWCFFYATLHVLVYGHFYLGWDWQDIVSEIIKRPYILVGACAWLILITLALTSPLRVRRWLGRRWVRLHRSIYLAALLVLLHFGWQLKGGYHELVLYVSVFLGLMLFRLFALRRPRSAPV